MTTLGSRFGCSDPQGAGDGVRRDGFEWR